jgi:hypothetical protein
MEHRPGSADPDRLTAAHRARALSTLAWPAALAALATWGVVLAARGRGSDFAIYVRASSRFLSATLIYGQADGAYVFKYAPPSAAAFIPFVFVPLKLATALWDLTIVACLAVCKPLLAALLMPGRDESRAPLSSIALVASLVAVGQSLFLELFYGQVNVLLLLLLLASASFAERGRAAMAGSAWALAVALKPTAVLFGLHLAARRPRAILLGVAAGLLLWVPILARYGPSGTVALTAAWTQTLASTTAPWVLGANSQGLPTVLLLVLGAAPTTWTTTAAQLGALAIAASMLWLARRSPAHLLAASCFSVAFTSPHAWRANFVLALPMIALAATDRSRLRPLSLALASLAAFVELATVADVLGEERLQTALLARPFALAFGALFVFTVYQGTAVRPRPAAALALEGDPRR